MERRYSNSAVELRAEGEEKRRAIGGTAAMVNTPTVLYSFKRDDGKVVKLIETIRPGAFNDALGDDVRALFNHNDDKVLGRTSAGTLKVYLTEGGHLGYDVPDVPATTYGNDLLVSVDRGDVNQSSFGFTIDEMNSSRIETDTEVLYQDEIVRISKLYDVSPVTFPAYSDTVTELRSYSEARIEEIRKQTEKPEEPTAPGHIDIEQQQLELRIRIAKNK